MTELTTFIDGTILRTARKEHRCARCGKPIRRGERYAEYLGETAFYQAGTRYHLGDCELGTRIRVCYTQGRARSWPAHPTIAHDPDGLIPEPELERLRAQLRARRTFTSSTVDRGAMLSRALDREGGCHA